MSKMILPSVNYKIQTLRAIAVLVVVLNHFGAFHNKAGFYGVDLFFIISGYVITKQLISNTNLKSFYLKRINRILPLSVIVVVLTLLASYILFGTFTLQNISAPVPAISYLWANMYYLQHYTNYFSLGEGTSPFLHFWSLAVEEQFYLFWPILLTLSLKRSIKVAKFLLFSIISLSFLLFLYYSNVNPAFSFYSLPTRAWELGLGAFVALYTIGKSFSSAKVLNLLLVFLISIFVLLTFILPNTSSSLIAISLLSVTLILLSLNINDKEPKIFKPFHLLGNYSYAIYLVHFPMYILYTRKTGNPLSLSEGLLLLFTTLVISGLLYSFFENPLRYKLNTLNSLTLSSSLLIFSILASSVVYFYQPTKSDVKMEPIFTISNQLSEQLSTSLKSEYQPGTLQPDLVNIRAQLDLVDGMGECIPGATMCTHSITPDEKTVVLFGDSHATMWWSSLYHASLKSKFNAILFSKGGCPPAIIPFEQWVSNPPPRQKYDECLAWFNSSVSAIKKLSPNILIITGSGTTSTWANNLPSTFNLFSELPARKVLLGDFSYPNTNILDCYSKNSSQPALCNHPLEANLIASQRQAERNAVEGTKWEFVLPDTLLCVEDQCPAVVSDIYVYRDQWHLTRYFGKLIADDFARLLKLV